MPQFPATCIWPKPINFNMGIVNEGILTVSTSPIGGCGETGLYTLQCANYTAAQLYSSIRCSDHDGRVL